MMFFRKAASTFRHHALVPRPPDDLEGFGAHLQVVAAAVPGQRRVDLPDAAVIFDLDVSPALIPLAAQDALDDGTLLARSASGRLARFAGQGPRARTAAERSRVGSERGGPLPLNRSKPALSAWESFFALNSAGGSNDYAGRPSTFVGDCPHDIRGPGRRSHDPTEGRSTRQVTCAFKLAVMEVGLVGRHVHAF